MQNDFSDILSNYLDAKNTPFNYDSRVVGFFKSLVNSLKGLPCITSRPNINITFSVGKGNWAAIPWVSFLDNTETTTTQEGVYPVLLFNEDCSGFHLKFSQGVIKVTQELGKREGMRVLQSRAESYKVYAEDLLEIGFQFGNSITEHRPGSLGEVYLAASIASKYYDLNDLPTDTDFTNDLTAVMGAYDNYLASRSIPINSSSDNQNVGNGDNTPKRLATNIILYGPPGTGKTYNTVNEAVKIISPSFDEQSDRVDYRGAFNKLIERCQIVFTTFHQSFGYEEFVEGIKVVEIEGKLTYPTKSGIFKELCDSARKNVKVSADKEVDEKQFVIIIDEINRGNISKIFGELITLIEPDKRQGMPEQIEVVLPCSGEPFSVPKNVHIIGTMNTADASIAKLDVALRRRFDFKEMPPKPYLLTDDYTEMAPSVVVEGVVLKSLLESINNRIELLYDKDHTIGHSYFMSLTSSSPITDLKDVFLKNIIPLLQEYFFDDWQRIHWVLNDHNKPKGDRFVIEKELNESFLESIADAGDVRKVWELNEEAFETPSSYKGIYDEKSN
jgi:hypothetical protein